MPSTPTEALTAERNLFKGKYRALLKLISRTRNKLVLITDHIEDEGDRRYFGSTNHADELRELYHEMMSWIWDATDETNRMKSDPYADIRRQRARAEKAEAANASLLSIIEDMAKALEPLSKVADEFDRAETDRKNADPVWGYNNATVTYGDFRDARSALSRYAEFIRALSAQEGSK